MTYKIYTNQGDLSKIEYEYEGRIYYLQIVNGFYKHFYMLD